MKDVYKRQGMNCHINLIPVNPIKERDYVQSNKGVIEAFKNRLEKNGINVTIRRDVYKRQVSAATIRALEQSGFIEVITQSGYRNPVEHMSVDTYDKVLNAAQQSVVDAIEGDIAAGLRNTYLIKGVTGSGKTEVYMELIAHCIQSGLSLIHILP